MFNLVVGMNDVIILGRGDPDFPTPAHIIEAAKRALDEEYTHYTPWEGLLELRRAIAKKLAGLAEEKGFINEFQEDNYRW